MKLNNKVIFLSIVFFNSLLCSKNLPAAAAAASSAAVAGYDSNESLPEEYRHRYVNKIPPMRIDLDKLDSFDGVPEDRLHQWSNDNLEQKGFMVVHASNFLGHNENGFISLYPDRFEVTKETSTTPDKKYFISGLWESSLLSASLVNKDKYPVAGIYGLILKIPPELIIRTYQLDSTTYTHGQLKEIIKAENIKDIEKYLKESLELSVYNAEMGVGRIFAPGETEDSPDFMTPEEMISRGRPYEHNEVKFVPVGKYKGIDYRVQIKGIFYKDRKFNEPGIMELDLPTEEEIAALLEVGRELGLPVVPLSKGIV